MIYHLQSVSSTLFCMFIHATPKLTSCLWPSATASLLGSFTLQAKWLMMPLVSVWSKPKGLPMAKTFCPTCSCFSWRRALLLRFLELALSKITFLFCFYLPYTREQLFWTGLSVKRTIQQIKAWKAKLPWHHPQAAANHYTVRVLKRQCMKAC